MGNTKTFYKDPDEVLDYVFDWKALTNGNGTSDYLQSAETISSETVTVESGLTLDSESITDTNTTVTAWLSGGTAGTRYSVACEIVTNLGRTAERTIYVHVIDR